MKGQQQKPSGEPAHPSQLNVCLCMYNTRLWGVAADQFVCMHGDDEFQVELNIHW